MVLPPDNLIPLIAAHDGVAPLEPLEASTEDRFVEKPVLGVNIQRAVSHRGARETHPMGCAVGETGSEQTGLATRRFNPVGIMDEQSIGKIIAGLGFYIEDLTACRIVWITVFKSERISLFQKWSIVQPWVLR